MNYAGFFFVILLSNIIQGITGFAGTILAMPPSLMLVGYNTAKPVLNVLGLLSGIYIYAGNRKYVCWSEFRKIVAVMAVGIVEGIFLKTLFVGREQLLYRLLGAFVIFLSMQGLVKLQGGTKALRYEKETEAAGNTLKRQKTSLALYLLLGLAGIIHGIFVSGGPLVVGYLSRRLKDKVNFRATISTIWVMLNTIIFLYDIHSGLWNMDLIRIQIISVPFLLTGMFLGSRLYVKMSQRLFMIITYVLLLISGISLVIK